MGRTKGAKNKPKTKKQEEQPKMTEIFKEVENAENPEEKMYVREGVRFSEKERQAMINVSASVQRLTAPMELKDKLGKVADLYMEEVMDIETALIVIRNAFEQHSKTNISLLKTLKSELTKE